MDRRIWMAVNAAYAAFCPLRIRTHDWKQRGRLSRPPSINSSLLLQLALNTKCTVSDFHLQHHKGVHCDRLEKTRVRDVGFSYSPTTISAIPRHQANHLSPLTQYASTYRVNTPLGFYPAYSPYTMAPLVTINHDSPIPTIQSERPQERLRELLESYNRQISSEQGRRVRDPDVLAKSVWQYAKEHDLFQLALPSAAKSLSTRYPSLPKSVFAAWWEHNHSIIPRGKENRPPKPPAKRRSAPNSLSSPQLNQSPTHALKDYRVFPVKYHCTNKLSSQPTTVASYKPKLTTSTATTRPPSPPALPLLSSQNLHIDSRVSRKRRKVCSKADAISSSTNNVGLSPTQQAAHNKHVRSVLQEEQQQVNSYATTSKRFLWERMSIFDMTKESEASSTYSGRPLREEREGRFEYLAKHGLL